MLSPAAYWDREVTNPVTPAAHGWMAHPLVRHYINESISGSRDDWPLDWFQRAYPRTFERALSIGCGTGALERDLLRRNVTHTIDAFDLSNESLMIARTAAAAEGLQDRVTYFRGDFNAMTLQRDHYDLVCFHQSLHHVKNIEPLLREVLCAIKADGVLYLDEFIGPSRTDWNAFTVRWYRALYQSFPRNVRYFDDFAMPIQEEDPSEAIRSADIFSRLVIGFDVEQFRGYGGNILAMMFPDLVVPNLSDEQVDMLIRIEKSLLYGGDTHFHAVITARPKRDALRRLIAHLRYLIEPVFPRLFRELRFLKHYCESLLPARGEKVPRSGG